MALYLRLIYCNGNSNSSSKDFQQLENIYISWVTAAFIFFAAAVYVKGFEADTSVVSIVFIMIVLLMLIIINFDYLNDRCALIQQGQEVRNRLDYLFGIICVVIIAISIFAIDSIRRKKLLSGALI